ncbi:sensor domain-containing protein [Spirochaeta lutea]|uniref:sensor domain-containing protein n=1 Tax=Spirochaeta lutea TaxID=1480694 RepID=UPI000692079F|nr:EAL domain-containing protein [Spirochaeta lutea]
MFSIFKKKKVDSNNQLDIVKKYRHQLTAILSQTWETFWIIEGGVTKYISPGIKELTGYAEQEVCIKPGGLSELLGLDDPGLPPDGVYPLTHRDGSRRWIRTRQIRLEKRSPLTIFILQDITAEQSSMEQIHYLASFDPLTKLPNRHHFEKTLNQRIAQGVPMLIMFMDMDRFKEVNDVYGHALGDLLLQHMAERVSALVPPEGFLARFGGDEFALLVPHPGNPDEELDLAQGIVQEASEPVVIQGTNLLTGMSVGVCSFPRDGSDTQTLLTHADLAMYEAKTMGKDQAALYEPRMTRALERTMRLSQGLRRAIEQDELFLEYQPQFDLVSGELSAFEALVRWNHPELGLVPPSEFIPVAEGSHSIHLLGEWVLWRACAQMKEWSDVFGWEKKIAVNVSPYQLLNPNFVSVVAHVLIDTELQPSQLELEVTETALIQDIPRTLGVLSQLQDMGIELSLDDFGTEYASFNYLQQFRLNKLKIDKLFVQKFLENPSTSSIVQTIIQLGRSLNMRVLAEGVETQDQARGLISLGCQEVQGFFFGKPHPPEHWQTLLSSQTQQV